LLEPFSRISQFCVLGPISRAPIFGAGMFIFAGHRHVMNKLLNTEYEQNPSGRSGASETHIHTYTYRHSDGITKITFSCWGVLKTCKSNKSSEYVFSLPQQDFLICTIYTRTWNYEFGVTSNGIMKRPSAFRAQSKNT
jgi:hypothetical protein